jgi:translation elongation factor EF-1alpha
MSSIVKPLIATFEADGAIAKGKAVKIGTARTRVAVVSATTDPSIGIAQNAAVNAGDLVEVAQPGGGAKALAKATITAGDLLGHNADGSIQKVAAANDRVIAVAQESAAAGDLFAVMVQNGMATQTQS